MTRFVLAAVSHDVGEAFDDRLMCRESAALFNEKCLPLITADKTLVLGEGYDAGLVRPSDPLYDMLHRDIFGFAEDLRPTIGCFDFRQREARSAAMYFEVGEREDRWQKEIGRIIDTDWHDVPDTLAEAIRRVKNPPRAVLKYKPSRELVAEAKRVGSQSRKFDRVYLEAMRKHGRRYEVCMFIGGSSHVIAMALQSEYEVMDCVPPVEVRDAHFAYLSTYQWSRLVISAG
jgi:hypothetical protein